MKLFKKITSFCQKISEQVQIRPKDSATVVFIFFNIKNGATDQNIFNLKTENSLNWTFFFFLKHMFIIKQSPSHKTKRRNKKQDILIHNYTYVAQTNNRRSKQYIQEHVSKQYIC